jgi:hypothetical protein
MAVTPNYSWPVPVATDFVKDGWEAISDLGNAIDTTVAGLGTAALTQIIPTSIVKGASGSASVSASGVVTYTGTESISLNGCFSANYVNYKILYQHKGSASTATYMRVRASGTDNTTASSYQSQFIEARATSLGAAITTNNYWKIANTGSQDLNVGDSTIFQPFLAAKTGYTLIGSFTGDGTVFDYNSSVGQHSQTTSYDGFTLYSASGTLTGTLRVYGFKE